MKNKIMKLSIFLLIMTFIITGCKIQSVEEFNDENSSELNQIENKIDISEDTADADSLNEKDEKSKDSKGTSESDDKPAEKEKKEEEQANKSADKDVVSKSKSDSKQNTKDKDISKTSNNSKDKDKAKTQNVQTNNVDSTSKDKPVEKPKPKTSYVTIEIRVDEILKNYDKLDPKLQSTKFVPSNGVILGKSKFELKDGETVFDILVKATRQNRIHMEYQGSNKNQYGSAYIKGINNIYEFSCGELSGWRYKVNGTYPNVGVSAYKLKDGDNISFNYTCNLGRN